MLAEFLASHRQQVIDRATARIVERVVTHGLDYEEAQNGLAHFLEDIIVALRTQTGRAGETRQPLTNEKVPAHHGGFRFREGLELDDVVHDYGDLCTAITQECEVAHVPVELDEYRILNLCIDEAIALAVTEFSRNHDARIDAESTEQIGFIAHELRNALASATMAYDVMRREHLNLDGRTGDVVARAHSRLRRLVDELVSGVRLKAGKLRKEHFGLVGLAKDVVALGHLAAQARGIHFDIAGEPTIVVDADPQLLTSVLYNLIQNAIKFSTEGCQVNIRVLRKSGHASVEVEDCCGGLADNVATEMFQAFAQHAPNRSGLGLGLTLSREIIEAHSGSLSVRSLPGKGCVFVVELPAA